MKKNYFNNWINSKLVTVFFVLIFSYISTAQVVLENEILVSNIGLHFDGVQVGSTAANTGDSAPYDFYFGRNISASGDCITTYSVYVFMTWYRGGKGDRHVMLTRYNTITGTMATIEFPHRHTGYQNKYWIGESHNTIAVGVSPIDGTIHLLYDMHAYSATKPSDGSLEDDYFRYSYSIQNAASVSDAEFTLDKFVQNSQGGYKHLSINGGEDYDNFAALTYPKFFLNDAGDLFMYMREGGNNNGAYKFSKYSASTSTWSDFTQFNIINASNQGEPYNWGLYGNMKYVNGKIRIGFQRRSGNNNDKYQYQNGVYYAYSDDQDGLNSWKDHSGTGFSLPLINADLIKVMEPGDYVQTTATDMVRIVDGFDWTVTEQGDVHIISKVKDNEFNVTKYLHTYKPAGATDFITSEDFAGASSIYTSGDNVYIIGLTSGRRVFVEKAEGGTNNFTRVYEATSGKTFNHGRVHINSGKLFYYLLEHGDGSARPLCLQIIDLDIVPADPTDPSNFTIEAIGETCADKANGKLVINGAATHDYIATINGVDYDFNKNKTIEGLSPGTYDLCIEVVGENYNHCYQVTIEEAPSLTGRISVSKQSAMVSVESGEAPYTVIKNGQHLFETYQSNFSIDVNHGDIIQIKGKEACQGKMIKTINLFENSKAYPNPTSGLFELYIPNNLETIDLEVYNIQSQLIVSKTYAVNTGKVQLNLEDKPMGIYFVKVNSKKPVYIKVIKK